MPACTSDDYFVALFMVVALDCSVSSLALSTILKSPFRLKQSCQQHSSLPTLTTVPVALLFTVVMPWKEQDSTTNLLVLSATL